MLYSLRCSFGETNSCLYTHWRAPVHLSVFHTNKQFIYWTNMLLHCGWIEVLYTIAHKRAEGCWNETLNQWKIPPVEISYHLIHVKCILKSKWMRMCTAFWRTPHKGDSLKLPFDGTTPMKTTPVQYSLISRFVTLPVIQPIFKLFHNIRTSYKNHCVDWIYSVCFYTSVNGQNQQKLTKLTSTSLD